MTQPRQQAWTNLPLLPSLKLSTPVPYPLFGGSPRRLLAARGKDEAPYGISQSQGSSASKNPADDMPKLLNIRGDQLSRRKEMGKGTPASGGGVNQSFSLERLSNKEMFHRQSMNDVSLDEDRKQVLTHSKKSLPHLTSQSPNTVTPFQSNQPKQTQTTSSSDVKQQQQQQEHSLKHIPEDYHILPASQPVMQVAKADQETQTDEQPPQKKIIDRDVDSFKVQSRFKSFKDINDSYARQLEQREKQIEKWKSMHSNALEQLRGKTEELNAYEKALASSENQIQSLRQQLDDALDDILKKEKRYQIARSEMKEIRKDTTEYQTLMDENVFLKQELNIITKQKAKLEETTTKLQTGLSSVKNWSQVSGLAYSNQLQDYLIIRIHEYQIIINKEKLQRDQLTSSENRNKQLEDENTMLLRTNRALIEEVSVKSALIEELAPHKNQSKAYKRIQESALEEKEREITNLLLSFDKRSFRKTSLEGDSNSKQAQSDQSPHSNNSHLNSTKKDNSKQQSSRH